MWEIEACEEWENSYRLRREVQQGCWEIHFLSHPILVVTWHQALMEEVVTIDNDCLRYLPAVPNCEMM